MFTAGIEVAQRYRIVRFVARGGMGEVYEATDEALSVRVALKTVSAHSWGDVQAISALKQEVQLARRISHKNVCRIYDLGRHALAEGPPIAFLTMEFIDGVSLAERIRELGKLSVPEVRSIALGILEGLAAAHDAGVIHRDLKTDNVMLRRLREDTWEPVLMDFGLASALNPNSSRVSGDQALVGSLAYMAPEQVRGEPLRVATDLYAFGVIVFEMLTGRLPFEGPTPAIAAIRRLQEPAPTLSSLDPSLPSDLNALVNRCLERDPKRRHSSARALMEVLNTGVDTDLPRASWAAPQTSGTSTQAPSTSLVAPSLHEGKAREWRLWLTLTLALLTVVALALTWRVRSVPPTAPSAEANFAEHAPDPETQFHARPRTSSLAIDSENGATSGEAPSALVGALSTAPSASARGSVPAATTSRRLTARAEVTGAGPAGAAISAVAKPVCPEGILCPDSLAPKSSAP
jgi:serine/threonine protein kinase